MHKIMLNIPTNQNFLEPSTGSIHHKFDALGRSINVPLGKS